MDVLDRVKGICSWLSGEPVEQIGDHRALDHSEPGGLDLDSLDRLQLVMELEEAFAIEIPDDDVRRMTASPAGVVSYLKQRGVANAEEA